MPFSTDRGRLEGTTAQPYLHRVASKNYPFSFCTSAATLTSQRPSRKIIRGSVDLIAPRVAQLFTRAPSQGRP